MNGSWITELASEAKDDIMSNTWKSIQFAQEQGRFEEQKYVTRNRYQIAVDDMVKAGINPLMAVRGGAGAPSAQGGSVDSKPHQRGNSQTGMTLIHAALAKSTIDLNKKKEETEIRKQAVMSQEELLLAEKQNLLYIEKEIQSAMMEGGVADLRLKKLRGEILKLSIDSKLNFQRELEKRYSNYRNKHRGEMYKGKAGKALTKLEYLKKHGLDILDSIKRNPKRIYNKYETGDKYIDIVK